MAHRRASVCVLAMALIACDSKAPPVPSAEADLAPSPRERLDLATTRLEALAVRPWLRSLPIFVRVQALRQAAGQLAGEIDRAPGQIATPIQLESIAVLEREWGAQNSVWAALEQIAPLFDALHSESFALGQWLDLLEHPPLEVFDADQRWRTAILPRVDEATRLLGQALEMPDAESRAPLFSVAQKTAEIARQSGRELREQLEPRVLLVAPFKARWKRLLEWRAWAESGANAPEQSERLAAVREDLRVSLEALLPEWNAWRVGVARGELTHGPAPAWIEALAGLEQRVDALELQALAERLGLPRPPR